MTDPELNEAVARKLGWTFFPCGGFSGWGYETLEPTQANPPAYSTSIEAAWEVLESIKTPFSLHIYRMNNWQYRCILQPTDIQAEAGSASRAICAAFLKLPDREPSHA